MKEEEELFHETSVFDMYVCAGALTQAYQVIM